MIGSYGTLLATIGRKKLPAQQAGRNSNNSVVLNPAIMHGFRGGVRYETELVKKSTKSRLFHFLCSFSVNNSLV